MCQELEFKLKEYAEQASTLQTQLFSIDDKIKTKTKPIYTHIHSTDFHGSAASFVSSLVNSEVARFVADEPEIIYFNISTNNTYKTLREANSSCEDKRDIIPIFNLEPNPKFDGAYTYGGDIIDRDPYSVNLYCSMLNLVMKGQVNGKNISYLIGNHEGIVICGDFKSAISNGFNTCYSKETENDANTESDTYILKKLQKNLKQAVVEEKIKMCCQIPTTNTIVSHVVYTRDNLIAMFDKIIKPFSNAEEHLSDFILSEYFNGIAQGCLDTLKKYLIDNHKHIIVLREKLVSMDNNDKILLNQEEILQLSHIVNLFGKIYFLTTTQEIEETLSNIMSASGIEYTYDSFTDVTTNPIVNVKTVLTATNNKKQLGLLWKRSLITTGLKTTEVNTNYKKVNGVLFLVGHDTYTTPEVLRSENVIYCDTLQCKFFRQSCFGLENSSATFFTTTGDGEYKRTTLVPEILQPLNVVKEMENIIETGKSEIETVKTIVTQKKVETQNIRE